MSWTNWWPVSNKNRKKRVYFRFLAPSSDRGVCDILMAFPWLPTFAPPPLIGPFTRIPYDNKKRLGILFRFFGWLILWCYACIVLYVQQPKVFIVGLALIPDPTYVPLVQTSYILLQILQTQSQRLFDKYQNWRTWIFGTINLSVSLVRGVYGMERFPG